jgi:hypothetical protein
MNSEASHLHKMAQSAWVAYLETLHHTMRFDVARCWERLMMSGCSRSWWGLITWTASTAPRHASTREVSGFSDEDTASDNEAQVYHVQMRREMDGRRSCKECNGQIQG